jgi:hypothetical protein
MTIAFNDSVSMTSLILPSSRSIPSDPAIKGNRKWDNARSIIIKDGRLRLNATISTIGAP